MLPCPARNAGSPVASLVTAISLSMRLVNCTSSISAAHIAELNKRVAETELRLKRLYDAIEAGVADLNDPALKERVTSLKAIRDQAQVDAERAAALLESSGQQAITPQMVRNFARTARERMRIDGGARLPSASRSRTAKSGSRDQKAIRSGPAPSPRA